MIPKELHLRNILDTTIEELARLPSATAEEWALIDRAAAHKKMDRWAYLRSLLTPDLPGVGAKCAALRRRWLSIGKDRVLTLLWGDIIQRAAWACHLAESAEQKIASARELSERRGEETKAKVLRRDEQAARVAALQAVPCAYRASESIRAGELLGYVLGRLAALRTFRGFDWRCIDKAAAIRGQTWLEFMAVEIVRFAVDRASVCDNGARARLWRASLAWMWRKWGEAHWIAVLWVQICHRSELIIQGKADKYLVFGGIDKRRERERLEPSFAAFVKGESLPPVPAWLMG